MREILLSGGQGFGKSCMNFARDFCLNFRCRAKLKLVAFSAITFASGVGIPGAFAKPKWFQKVCW
ncbi:MAG: hypothetical protein LBJ95_00670 [Oscillospiraceae bacterium]|jgi:hypothetical protein|nr:hypothetical protein [Oscillospiraceae bacterium]